jgi:hypothetical protein
MAKKTSIIESLVEESRLKEIQIEKMRAMLDKQRRELLSK